MKMETSEDKLAEMLWPKFLASLTVAQPKPRCWLVPAVWACIKCGQAYEDANEAQACYEGHEELERKQRIKEWEIWEINPH